MSDSVSGVPVFTLADLAVASAGVNSVGPVSDADTLTITTPGTNASLSAGEFIATGVVHSGSGTGGTVFVTVDGAGIVLFARLVGVTGLADTDTITIDEIDSDANDTDCVLTVDDASDIVVRSRWNSRAVVAVVDHDADDGDGNERAYFVSDSMNNVWRLGRAKLGGETGNEDGPQIVIPQ